MHTKLTHTNAPDNCGINLELKNHVRINTYDRYLMKCQNHKNGSYKCTLLQLYMAAFFTSHT